MYTELFWLTAGSCVIGSPTRRSHMQTDSIIYMCREVVLAMRVLYARVRHDELLPGANASARVLQG